jgi:Ca2+-binding EF-hand superfamily protein
MATTKNVVTALELLIEKALGAGIDLEALEVAVRNGLERIESAQSDAYLRSVQQAGGTSPTRAHGGQSSDVTITADLKLGLEDFVKLAREREGPSVSDERIQQIFKAFEENGDGSASVHEYLKYSLAEALHATHLRATDLFNQWDEEQSGTIDENDFVQAVKALGYAVPTSVAIALFQELDTASSGRLEYSQLSAVLNRRASATLMKQELLRYTPQASNRVGMPLASDSFNSASVRVRALPAEVHLHAKSNVSIVEQLGMLLTISSAQPLINLLLEWDEEGSGGMSKREFRRALAGLGYRAPKSAVEALFEELDANHDGWMAVDELKKGVHKLGQKRRTSPPSGGSPSRPASAVRPSSSKSSLGSSASAAGLLTQKFKYSWSQDHSARWPYDSFPSQRALQVSLSSPARSPVTQ